MNLDRFTQKAREAVLASQQIAQDNHQQAISPEHILLALLEQQEGVVPAIVTNISGSVGALRDEIHAEIESHPKVYGADSEQASLSRPAAEAFTAAERYAKGMRDEYVSTEHILLGLTESPLKQAAGELWSHQRRHPKGPDQCAR